MHTGRMRRSLIELARSRILHGVMNGTSSTRANLTCIAGLISGQHDHRAYAPGIGLEVVPSIALLSRLDSVHHLAELTSHLAPAMDSVDPRCLDGTDRQYQ